ncbi:MAG: alpha/beta fold hydrolase [Gammaproteobacteria bacterium]
MKDLKFLNWRSHRIHVADSGEGEPLLLVSGLGCDADMWAPFMQEFAGRRIIRFDAPGTGRSSSPLLPVSIADLADLTATVLDTCDVTSADVIGFSYGGTIAQQFAFDHPDRVRRLVLAATTCGLGSLPGSMQAMAVLANTLRFYSPTYFDQMVPSLFGGVTGRNSNANPNDMIKLTTSAPSSYAYAMQVLGAAGWTSLPFLDQIRHETLVINGDDDPLVSVANAQMLAQRIPRAQLEIVAQAGHLFLWDDAVNLAPRISRFVNAPSRTN